MTDSNNHNDAGGAAGQQLLYSQSNPIIIVVVVPLKMSNYSYGIMSKIVIRALICIFIGLFSLFVLIRLFLPLICTSISLTIQSLTCSNGKLLLQDLFE